MTTPTHKTRRRDVFKDEFGGQILFFRVPLELQKYLSTLTDSELRVYIYFLTQVSYQNTLQIQTTRENIMYETGISNTATVTKAIQGLAKHGFIENIFFQRSGGNRYTINLIPHVNKELLKRVVEHGKKLRKARKKSIENGEKGKFKSSETEGSK
jgi:predicted transcriptional regulator